MSLNRRPSEGFSPGPGDYGISLVRTNSLDSLSSGGDSDGGPAEPTLAEISLLSASIDARNVEVAKEEVEDDDPPTIEVTEVIFPAGFHRLPSAMRPPVRRGHMRSASAGGQSGNFQRGQTTAIQRNNSSAASAASEAMEKQPQSVLKSAHRNHHRR